jgi:hypothetical protein
MSNKAVNKHSNTENTGKPMNVTAAAALVQVYSLCWERPVRLRVVLSIFLLLSLVLSRF